MKKLSNQAVLGQLGANLLERIVLEMGQVWRPTSIHDTGVDGEIELRDPETQEVFNRELDVQCKATNRSWESESASKFVFRVSKNDLDYWMQGNVPALLVVVRPASEEAYWMPLNTYFADPSNRQSRRIEFSKMANRFDRSVLPALWDVTLPAEKGLYKPPQRIEEELVSNLLPVQSVANSVYLGETTFRIGADLMAWLKSHGYFGDREWVLRNGRILTTHDLRQPPWNQICDLGTVEKFDSSEWYESDDEDILREWVQLLNRCLAGRLFQQRIRPIFDGRGFVYSFSRDGNRQEREYSYRSLSNLTKRAVVQRMRTSKTLEQYCYRHVSMTGQFHRFLGKWYLEITPTYVYTDDGHRLFKYHSDQLAGLKRLERNPAVLGQLIMWEHLLTDRGDLLQEDYEYLKFNKLVRYDVAQGIPDELWLPTKDVDSSIDLDGEEEFLF